MTEHYFHALEQKIDQLLQHCEQLKQDNKHLLERERLLKDERNQLMQANEQTQSQVEAMIMRLKALEKNT